MYEKLTRIILKRLLPNGNFEDLPVMKWSENSTQFFQLTVSLVCRHRKNIGKFFYDMMSRWLIPGKHLNAALNFSMNFEKDHRDFSVCELILKFENAQDFSRAKRNLPFLKREILLGVSSSYHATKILEIKGLTLDDKISLVQEKIAEIVRRFPKKFDYDIFDEMQHFLVSSSEAFKAIHQSSQISRIIFILYRFRKELEQQVSQNQTKRHLCLKLKRIVLDTPFGIKEVLSIFIGLNFLKEHEFFEKRHIISSLSHLISGIQSVSRSYYVFEGQDEKIQTLYLEVEKDKGRPFSYAEISQLKRNFSKEILSRIEQLVPPVFMPRNEEEVMRNILVLSQQIKYLRDIPQMVVSFDEQNDETRLRAAQ